MDYLAKNPAELFEHVSRGQEFLQPFLDLYAGLRDEVVGSCWPGVGGQRPVNLLYEYMTCVEAYCSVPRIRSSVTAKTASARVFAETVRLAQDQVFRETKFAQVLEEVGGECMFAPIAVVDVGRHEGSRVAEIDGELCNLQEAYCRLISLVDLSIDPDATSRNTLRHCSHRITVRKRTIRDTGCFGVDPQPVQMPTGPGMPGVSADGMTLDPAAAGGLEAQGGLMPIASPSVPMGPAMVGGVPVMSVQEATAYLLGRTDREDSSTPLDSTKREMAMQDQGGVSTMVPDESGEINLWRCVIYDGNKVWIAYLSDESTQPEKFLHVEEWAETKTRPDGVGGQLALGGGSPDGPLKFCTYQPVRNSFIGIPGLATILDLHDAAKKLSSKLVQQLLALKNLLLYSADAADDAMRVAKAKDLQAIKVKDATKFTTAPIGGTRGELETGISLLGDWYGNAAGGPRQLSGSGQAADTATAASFLQNGANMRMSRFRTRLWKLACDVGEELAFLGLFADPWAYRELEMQLAPGLNLPVVFNRAEIAADAMSFMFTVEPFPTPMFDPTAKRAAVNEFLAMVGQNLPFVQMGIMNPAALMRIGRVDYGLDDIDDLIVIDQMAGMAAQGLMGQNTMGLMPGGVQQQGRDISRMNQMQGQVQAQHQKTGGAPGRVNRRPPSGQQKPPASGQNQRPQSVGAR